MKGEAEPVEIGGHFGHVIVSEIRSCGIEKGLLALFLHQMFFFSLQLNHMKRQTN